MCVCLCVRKYVLWFKRTNDQGSISNRFIKNKTFGIVRCTLSLTDSLAYECHTKEKKRTQHTTKKQLVKRWVHQFLKHNNLYLHDVRTRRIMVTPDRVLLLISGVQTPVNNSRVLKLLHYSFVKWTPRWISYYERLNSKTYINNPQSFYPKRFMNDPYHL